MEDPAGELVKVKYEAVEEKGALSTRLDHKEEPPMKEGEEFATAVEYWVTSLLTKFLSPKPPKSPTPPKLPDSPVLWCWDLLTQLPLLEQLDLVLSIETHGSLAAKLPPPRPLDPAVAEA